MTDPEREHLLQQVRDLQRRLNRWRLTALVLGAVLLLPVVLGGLLGVAFVPRWERRERALMMERDRALEAEMRAREAAAEAARLRDEAERARTEAEQRARPGKD
jgi:hypothetical protein